MALFPTVEKICLKCGEPKLLSAFSKHNASKDGLRPRCKDCLNAEGKKNRLENKEKVLARRKKYYQENRTRMLEAEKQRRFSNYGITQEDYDDLMAKQEGLCPICERSLFEGTKINIDHCHLTGKVRGILHNNCNMLLGLAGDDLNLLYNAIRYLAESRMPEEKSNKILKMEN